VIQVTYYGITCTGCGMAEQEYDTFAYDSSNRLTQEVDNWDPNDGSNFTEQEYSSIKYETGTCNYNVQKLLFSPLPF